MVHDGGHIWEGERPKSVRASILALAEITQRMTRLRNLGDEAKRQGVNEYMVVGYQASMADALDHESHGHCRDETER